MVVNCFTDAILTILSEEQSLLYQSFSQSQAFFQIFSEGLQRAREGAIAPSPFPYPRAAWIARRVVTSAGSPAGERTSGVVPASSLLLPSGFRPYIIVY